MKLHFTFCLALGSVKVQEGDPKIPGIIKEMYLKYLYKFETLVAFKVFPL
jgi:hypothetical protein